MLVMPTRAARSSSPVTNMSAEHIEPDDIWLLRTLLYAISPEREAVARGIDDDHKQCSLCLEKFDRDTKFVIQHLNKCWLPLLNEIKARPDYESLLAYIELQNDQALQSEVPE